MRILLLLSALVAVLVASVTGAVLSSSSAAPATEAPVVKPSVDVRTDLILGPEVEPTHGDLRFGPEVEGERMGGSKLAPLATPSQPGCTTRLLSTNFNSRGGVRPSMFVLHYTVSANRDGLSDVEAIFNFFNRSSSQASSNYIIDAEGNCWLIVPETARAWTQGAFNSASISIEFIAIGSESTEWWKRSDGLRKGARVVADSTKRWGIPVRFVNPVECTVTAGITDHNRLECGNTHTDVEPNFPYARFMELVKLYRQPCYRYQVKDSGEVLVESDRFRRSDRQEKLAAFVDARRRVLLERLDSGDHDVSLDRVKVACG